MKFDIWYKGFLWPQRLTNWHCDDYELMEEEVKAIIAHTGKEIGAKVDDPQNYVILPN